MVDYQNEKHERRTAAADGERRTADGGRRTAAAGYGGRRRRTMAHTDIYIWGLLVANDRSWWVVALGGWACGWVAP